MASLSVFLLTSCVIDTFTLTRIIFTVMQCGFACLEAGAVRSKNTTNIIMKNIMDIFISSLAYWLFGFALAYGDGNTVFGYTHWAGVGIDYGKMANWFFQCIFAATAATIVSGAVAERCNYIAYIVYSFVISGKSRIPSGDPLDMDRTRMAPQTGLRGLLRLRTRPSLGASAHSTALSSSVLDWGDLATSTPTLRRTTLLGIQFREVIINTVLGGSGGSIVMLGLCKLGLCGQAAWSFSFTLNAALAGMVSVCAGADVMAMWASFLSGAIAALIYLGLHHVMLRMKIDDPLDAVAVHFGAGLWGLISASLFGNGGVVYGASYESGQLLWHRIVGASVIILWGSVASCIMFGALKGFGVLRVTEEQELKGLDIAMHNEPGYPLKGWYVPPQFTLYPDPILVKTEHETLAKPELEPFIKPEVEADAPPMPEDEDENKPENEASARPKSMGEVSTR
ncbi:hypothetical protein ANN_12181 [Periplaneta americana]|uniref:Ammonium transporter AmtB-like domain-containing protein n=1 Tax=Periplaneta americana TaxID=6978 RepID=A0ABQ8THT7_PERAM|nr:hypothetical protein ANN_12181 [Periplaneta americana]